MPPLHRDQIALLAVAALAILTAGAILITDTWHHKPLRAASDPHRLGENQHPEDLATPGRW